MLHCQTLVWLSMFICQKYWRRRNNFIQCQQHLYREYQCKGSDIDIMFFSFSLFLFFFLSFFLYFFTFIVWLFHLSTNTCTQNSYTQTCIIRVDTSFWIYFLRFASIFWLYLHKYWHYCRSFLVTREALLFWNQNLKQSILFNAQIM